MKFNFKLERVLNYKETIEDLKKNQYGTIQQKLNTEENKLEEFNRYKKNLLKEKNLSVTKTNVGNLAMYDLYIKDISTRIKKQKKVVSEIKIELEDKKEEMITAVQEKKIFEKLKEKEYEKYLYEIKKEDEKNIDSIISYKINTQ